MGWQQLKEIIDESRKAAEEEAARPLTECPECCYTGLNQNQNSHKSLDKVDICLYLNIANSQRRSSSPNEDPMAGASTGREPQLQYPATACN